eukprot:CAMPEP_0202454704 /NCGR_PEP_ID=MMETSP1360-20130828/12371_1 /ASSEMBLY_ACC=CAM_ASM_000848 /TAXON_ID=515479 /ORGANISM="Licmophora paradoxa, Strain CCMP2313" /LENGTH=400 /DNA_ID=CAMNT_0049074087 /DNA_START=37 /DNA_END=1239 /DNA_ORIENTATION=+
MDHLRSHPMFDPLPLPTRIHSINHPEDVRYFRQESWQWDALHYGRCTTSKASAALGFLEPNAGKALGIPVGFRKGAMEAYERLAKQIGCIQSLEDMQVLLTTDDKDATYYQPHRKQSWLWKIPTSNQTRPFAARYAARQTAVEREQRRKELKSRKIDDHRLIRSFRLDWGNSQEATSILTALNYFWQKDPGIRIKEVGMCGAGLPHNITGESLQVGATPDALIYYPNGTVEALEVKNHCPLIRTHFPQIPSHVDSHERNTIKRNRQRMRYTFRRKPITEPYLPIQYIPQLMMEMMCVGPKCHSAVMVRQTALEGALIIRLYRDDTWIDEMMYWLSKFQEDFVDKQIPPRSNFFWKNPRYRKFLEQTRNLTSNVELLDHIPNDAIQRMSGIRGHIPHPFLE